MTLLQIFFLVLCIVTTAKSGPGSPEGSPRSIALSGASSPAAPQNLNLQANPARVLQQGFHLEISASHPYGIRELESTALALAWQKKHWNLYSALSTLGLDSIYRELHTIFSIAGKLPGAVQLGGGLAFTRKETANFGIREYISLSTGMVLKLVEELSLGVYVNKALNLQSAIGLSWSRSSYQLDLALGKTPNGLDQWSIGQSWKVGPVLDILTGLAAAPFRWSLGLQVRAAPFRLTTSRMVHSRLGSTNAFGLAMHTESSK